MLIFSKNKTPTEAWEKKVTCGNCKSGLKLKAEDIIRTYYVAPPWRSNNENETLYNYECPVCGEYNKMKRPPENIRIEEFKETGLITEFDPNTGIGYLIENRSYGAQLRRQIPFLIKSTMPEDLKYKKGDLVEFDSLIGSRAWEVKLCKVKRFIHVDFKMVGEKAWTLPVDIAK
jgi:hypothetical protein